MEEKKKIKKKKTWKDFTKIKEINDLILDYKTEFESLTPKLFKINKYYNENNIIILFGEIFNRIDHYGYFMVVISIKDNIKNDKYCDERYITIYCEKKYYNIQVTINVYPIPIRRANLLLFESEIDKDKIKTDYEGYYKTLNLPALVYCIITGLIVTKT